MQPAIQSDFNGSVLLWTWVNNSFEQSLSVSSHKAVKPVIVHLFFVSYFSVAPWRLTWHSYFVSLLIFLIVLHRTLLCNLRTRKICKTWISSKDKESKKWQSHSGFFVCLSAYWRCLYFEIGSVYPRKRVLLQCLWLCLVLVFKVTHQILCLSHQNSFAIHCNHEIG